MDSHDTVARDMQGLHVELFASVLCLRGAGDITSQPLKSKDERLWLVWNGQIFECENDDDALVDARVNDARVLMDRLDAPGQDILSTLMATLGLFDGPYAFVLVDVCACMT